MGVNSTVANAASGIPEGISVSVDPLIPDTACGVAKLVCVELPCCSVRTAHGSIAKTIGVTIAPGIGNAATNTDKRYAD